MSELLTKQLEQALGVTECLLNEAVRGAEQMNAELASLRQQLSAERTEHARTMHGRDTLRAELDRARDQIEAMANAAIQSQSQPRLQRVTPEAMEEIKRRDAAKVLFVTPFKDADGNPFVSHNILHWHHETQQWYEDDDYPAEDTELSHDWFIDLSTIPEVT